MCVSMCVCVCTPVHAQCCCLHEWFVFHTPTIFDTEPSTFFAFFREIPDTHRALERNSDSAEDFIGEPEWGASPVAKTWMFASAQCSLLIQFIPLKSHWGLLPLPFLSSQHTRGLSSKSPPSCIHLFNLKCPLPTTPCVLRVLQQLSYPSPHLKGLFSLHPSSEGSNRFHIFFSYICKKGLI